MSEMHINPANCRVIVCETSSPMRKVLMDSLRALQFQQLTSSTSLKDLIEKMEAEPVDWVIAPLEPSDEINGLHVLKLLTEVSHLRRTRFSFLLRPEEEFVLPLAFENGLLSYHNRSLPMTLGEEFRHLRTYLQAYNGNTTLVASAYLRRYLKKNRYYNKLLALEKSLLEIFPGSCDILINVAEAWFLNGENEKALATIRQINLLGSNYQAKTQVLINQYVPQENLPDVFDLSNGESEESHNDANKGVLNSLGIESCLIVDPDTTVQFSIKQCLTEAGVPQVIICNSGEDAWQWIESGGRPDLIIQEWRLPPLTGPMLIQRIRSKGLVAVPVIVVSSLIKEEDVSLVLEMGVSAVVEKPFEHCALFKKIIGTLQQNKMPTEQLSLEWKIRNLLESGNIAEAKRLQAQYLANESFEMGGKLGVLAEVAFFESDFERARDFAFQSLRMSRDSLQVLNLLGKTLLKLGDSNGALKCFGKAQSLSPKNVERLCNIATIELDLGNIEAAEDVLVAAKNMDAGSSRVKDAEAKIALTRGDVERARNALGGLESVSRIVSFMNNKAVTLTRCGQFESGIELYHSTLQSLPGDWSHTHDVVLYNLSLAYVRYSELENAYKELVRIRSDCKSQLGTKVTSLKNRIEYALKTGTRLVLPDVNGNAVQIAAVSKRSNGSLERVDFDRLIESIEIGRGDMCCYRIFFGLDLVHPESIALLSDPPGFKKREAIERAETLMLKPGC